MKLVHLVGFIIKKFVSMKHGHVNVKKIELHHYDSSDMFCRAHSSWGKDEEISLIRNCKTGYIRMSCTCAGECYGMARNCHQIFIE